ncbi:DUF2971 domain-containing protein [Devosia sp. Root105]|uniref:DUF2971 domain-containing protein n=1 Tax=Devosia sp. Root105 TaxID=1736423 RepID=UPI0006F9A2A9|nr:DUF2971 domain-containing protein [Devosia sp. Root105]KQU95209.1 hypothetical protein ASC68_18835 [Devosia sp. Root105]
MVEQRSRADVWALVNDALYAELMAEGHEYFDNLPLLAHYTSISTFEAIVKNDEVWFSNPLFMNDIEEVRFGIQEGTDAYYFSDEIATALGGDDTVADFRACLDNCVKNFEVNHVFDTYILCLSEQDRSDEDGLLSMWRGYGDGGKGVAIVFDGTPMAEEPDSPILIGKVDYRSTQERHDWFKGQAALFAEQVLVGKLVGEEILYATEALFGRLRLASLFSKHVGFSEEREWRIAYLPERDHGALLHAYRGYFVTARGAEPKLKLKIKPIPGVTSQSVSLETLVKTILLGPSLQAPLLRQSVTRMLELMGRPELAWRVKASRIPFRPTGLQF